MKRKKGNLAQIYKLLFFLVEKKSISYLINELYFISRCFLRSKRKLSIPSVIAEEAAARNIATSESNIMADKLLTNYSLNLHHPRILSGVDK